MKRHRGGDVLSSRWMRQTVSCLVPVVSVVSHGHGRWLAIAWVILWAARRVGMEGCTRPAGRGGCLIGALVVIRPERRLGSGTLRAARDVTTGGKWRDEEGVCRCEVVQAVDGALEAARPMGRW
jgi:hypothetical protein